jgi:AI-2 transport protein TqsA
MPSQVWVSAAARQDPGRCGSLPPLPVIFRGIVLYALATGFPQAIAPTVTNPDRSRPGPGNALLGAAAVVIIIGGLKMAAPLVVPFLLAIVLATILIPPLHWLTAHRLPLPVAILVLSLGLVLIWIPLAAIVGASFDSFSAALPGYQEKIQALVASVATWLGDHGIEAGRAAMEDLVRPAAALTFVRQIGGGLGTALANFFLILLTIIFILFEASGFPAKVREAVGDRDEILDSFREFSARLQEYLRIKTLVSLMTGGTIAVWLWIVGLDFAMLWGVLAFLLNYVPNIGSIIAAVPAVLLAVVALDWIGVLLVLAGFVAVNLVFGNFVEPRMMGKGLGLSTLVVFLSLVFWGWVLGPVGMLLSGPLTMAVKIALETDPRTRWFAVLLGPARQVAQVVDKSETDAVPAARQGSQGGTADG